SDVEPQSNEILRLVDALGKMREEGKSTDERRQFLTDFFAKLGGVVGLARGVLQTTTAGAAITGAVNTVALRRVFGEVGRVVGEAERRAGEAERRAGEAERRARRREQVSYVVAAASLLVGILLHFFAG